ncbi:MAG: hypothetical protein H0X24_09680, partial [Ktedonobacterales bacterium]|nr:hypothetical protein [Ktedonobacterales bacterium]
SQHRVAGGEVTKLLGVRVATDDLQAAMRAYIALLGVVPIEQTRTSAHFVIGDQWIALQASAQPEDAIAQQLRTHGAGSYAIVLGGAAPGTPPRQLAATLAHGAEIWLE